MSNELSLLNPETFLPDNAERPVPWSLRDTLIGFGLFVVAMIAMAFVPVLLKNTNWGLSLYVLVYQPIQFIPIWIILRLRGGSFADLGLRKAQPNVLALGCGLLVALLFVNVVNNLIMFALGVEVQAQQFSDLLGSLDQPTFLLITGIVFAPLFEEMVFRGFLFAGLRQKMRWGWAALISSAIFGAGHLSLAAFIPTFALGLLFTYLYQRSNSIWPGIILHTLINSTSLCLLMALMQSGIPLGF